jgi:CO/xanthine dehydrogenase Mo-binding subunit
MRFGIGQPVARTEDPRFLKGRGRYIADIDLARQIHAVFVFALHAHAVPERAIHDGASHPAARLSGFPLLLPKLLLSRQPTCLRSGKLGERHYHALARAWRAAQAQTQPHALASARDCFGRASAGGDRRLTGAKRPGC